MNPEVGFTILPRDQREASTYWGEFPVEHVGR